MSRVSPVEFCAIGAFSDGSGKFFFYDHKGSVKRLLGVKLGVVEKDRVVCGNERRYLAARVVFVAALHILHNILERAGVALLAKLGQKPLSEALKARPGVRLCSARVSVDNRAAAMGRLCEQLPLAREDEGLRLFLDGGEVRVSPSAHAEELRVVAAGVREETARELCARAEKLIRSGALDKKEETGYN